MKGRCTICKRPTCYHPPHKLDPDLENICKHCHDRYCILCMKWPRRRLVRIGRFISPAEARRRWTVKKTI